MRRSDILLTAILYGKDSYLLMSKVARNPDEVPEIRVDAHKIDLFKMVDLDENYIYMKTDRVGNVVLMRIDEYDKLTQSEKLVLSSF